VTSPAGGTTTDLAYMSRATFLEIFGDSLRKLDAKAEAVWDVISGHRFSRGNKLHLANIARPASPGSAEPPQVSGRGLGVSIR